MSIDILMRLCKEKGLSLHLQYSPPWQSSECECALCEAGPRLRLYNARGHSVMIQGLSSGDDMIERAIVFVQEYDDEREKRKSDSDKRRRSRRISRRRLRDSGDLRAYLQDGRKRKDDDDREPLDPKDGAAEG